MMVFQRTALALLVLAGTARAVDPGDLCAPYDSCFTCAEHVTPQDYVKFKYYACFDQLNIVPDDIECNAFETDNFTFYNQTVKAGEYKHYHWTLTTYSLINHEKGASITFEVVPEVGYPQMFTKAQILYGGLPMCQMFETQPGTRGYHSETWPFPDKNTGAQPQGPEEEIADLEEENTPTSMTYEYPGSVFSEVTWGFNASGYDSDKRPKVHTVTIPHVSYGGYFVSVYAGDNRDAAFSISVRAERTIDIVEEKTEYAEDPTPNGVKAVSSWWSADYCEAFSDSQRDCERHCCQWSNTTESGDDARRRMTELSEVPAFERKLAGDDAVASPNCVQAPVDALCISEKESEDDGSTPEPTILVSFQTGSDPNEKYQLYYVEMNDCASQMDRNGEKYCWDKGWYTDGDRLTDLLAEGGRWIEPTWVASCGKGAGYQVDNKWVCDPADTRPGYCNFDGSGSWQGTPAETMWTNAYDCIVWTPQGLHRHGLPVSYTQYQDPEKGWTDVGEDWDGDVESLYPTSFNNSLRLKGLVTSFDLEAAAVDGSVLFRDWLTLPPSTWITTQVGIYNNVSYFFNVLKLKPNGETLDCYKGTTARTKFWRQTTLIPVEMIQIIAVIVIVLLLALLVPFVLTKRKITAHLRDVYESYKYKGYLRSLEERENELRQERKLSAEKAAKSEANDDDNGVHAIEDEAGGKKHRRHRKDKRANKHQIQPVAHNSKHGGGEDLKEGSPAVTDQASATL